MVIKKQYVLEAVWNLQKKPKVEPKQKRVLIATPFGAAVQGTYAQEFAEVLKDSVK